MSFNLEEIAEHLDVHIKSKSKYTGIALNGVIGLAMALAGYYVRGKTLY